MKIWERYFLKKLLANAFLFLFVFYGLYVLIDFSSHLGGAHYHHSRLKIGEFILHYASEFSLKADLLLPFALLIGTIQTLTQLNIHSELVSLLASGHSIHRLTRPFLYTALLVVGLLYLNNEWLIPKAAHGMQELDRKYKTKKRKESGLAAAQALVLDDGSQMIYREFDPILKKFYEVYWIPSIDELWRIQELDPFKETPEGTFVDHFKRSDEGSLSYSESFQNSAIPGLRFDEAILKAILLESENLPLSQLIISAPTEEQALENEKASRALTALYRKLALPWLAFVAVIGMAPFCVRFSRALPRFLIFAGGIFGLASIYLFFDAATVLGQRQVLTPFNAIIAPMGAILLFCLYRFIRMGR